MRPWWVVVTLGCSAAAPPPTGRPPFSEPSEPAAPDSSVAQAADAGGATDATDTPDTAATPAAAASEWPAAVGTIPAIAGPVTTIDEEQTVTVGGVKITMGRSRHKHRADSGRAVGIWAFTLARGKRKAELELRSSVSRFEAEIVEHGMFFVFRHVSYGTFEIVLAGTKAPKALAEDVCDERIDQEATRIGLPRGGSASLGIEHGVVERHELGWVGHCGIYSGRVWFTKLEAE